jgi:hypothetical protein
MVNTELENKLKDLTADLRNLANKEAGEARSRSAGVNATRDNVHANTKQIREIALGDWTVKKKEPEKKKTEGLVSAAEEQKRQAYLVADEADRFAESVQDGNKKEKIRNLSKQVRRNADELVVDAAAYDADPNDASLERRFAETQKKLVESIGEIVNLCGDQVFACFCVCCLRMCFKKLCSSKGCQGCAGIFVWSSRRYQRRLHLQAHRPGRV